MKKFDYGWWNCFNSYTNEITFNIGGSGVNSTVCLRVLSNAGITIEEAEDAIKKDLLYCNALDIVNEYITTRRNNYGY